jgi:hypothetical protein
MKFKDARVGMEVVITGEHADKFPKGAIIAEKDGTDNSIKIVSKETYDFELWFWDINSRPPKFEWHSSYNMGDIHLDDKFRSLPSSTLPFADCLGLDFEKVKCFIDKEKGIIKVKQGDVEAKAKKAPQDKWDFRLGMGLALCRLKEKVSESKKMPFHTPYFYAMSTEATNHSIVGIYPSFFMDAIQYAMGNVFNTEEEAESACKEMALRTQMIVDFCKKQGW